MKSKKLLIIALALGMIIVMCACGSKTSQTGPENPFVEVESAEALAQETPYTLEAPEGATDVVYSYCNDANGELDFVQVQFAMDGIDYTYRCKDSGALNDIFDGASPTELVKALSDCTNPGAALAGMYYDWQAGGTTMVQERPAVFGTMSKAGPGMIAWLDYVPGALYSLSADDGVTQDTLTQMAEKIFVPLQGEVG